MKISQHQEEEKLLVFLRYQLKLVGIVFFLRNSLIQNAEVLANLCTSVVIECLKLILRRLLKCSYMWKIKTQNPVQKPQKY